MNLFLFIIFLAEIPILLFTNEYALAGDYPFSIKLGYTEAITFMNNKDIAIYTVGNANPTTYSLNVACQTKEEKGAIYLNGYYYLSCLTSGNQFQINVYNHNFQHYKTYPVSTASPNYYTYNPGSSIRFFIKQSNQVLFEYNFKFIRKKKKRNNILLNLYSRKHSTRCRLYLYK